MLQFITKGTPQFSAYDEAKMAIEGGCRWIQLSSESLRDDETSLKEVAESIIPLCMENNCFMVIEDDIELVDELRVHGAYLHDATRSTVADARERLGANAVLGVQPHDQAELMELRGLDVDYAAVTPAVAAGAQGADPEGDMASSYRILIDTLRLRGIDFHIVALGDFSTDNYEGLLKAGVAGVAVSSAIADSPDPAAATARLISLLDEARMAAQAIDADTPPVD